MSEPTSAPGTIAWADLTVADAPGVRDFYRDVAGWSAHEIGMGDYSDFAMQAPGGTTVAGICHALGPNTGLPAQWLLYIIVPDVEMAAERCRELGGTVLAGPRGAGGGAQMIVIQDPAGAVCALYAPAAPS